MKTQYQASAKVLAGDTVEPSSAHDRLSTCPSGRVSIGKAIKVIAVITVLGCFGILGRVCAAELSAVERALADIKTIETDLIRYRTMAGYVPTQAQGLVAFVKKPAEAPIPRNWRKIADATLLIDPWGHPYQYRNPGNVTPNGYDVYSMGPDGKDGTADDVYWRPRPH